MIYGEKEEATETSNPTKATLAANHIFRFANRISAFL